MLSHKAGLLTVSFNEGGGMNVVTATGYDETDEKRMERVVNAYMSADRTIDSLLLFQTARVLNEYLDIKNERVAYVSLVRDILQYNDTSEEHFEIFNKKKAKALDALGAGRFYCAASCRTEDDAQKKRVPASS